MSYDLFRSLVVLLLLLLTPRLVLASSSWSCFSVSCVNAAVPAVCWKTSGGWFRSDWRCWSLKSAALVSRRGIKISLNETKRFKVTFAPRAAQNLMADHRRYVTFLRLVSSLFPPRRYLFINRLSRRCTVWRGSRLTIFPESWKPRQTTAVTTANVTANLHQTKLKNATSLSALIDVSIVLSPEINAAH